MHKPNATQQSKILEVLLAVKEGKHDVPAEFIRKHPKGDGVSVRYFKKVLSITETNGRVSELRGKGYTIQSSEVRDPHGFVYLRLTDSPVISEKPKPQYRYDPVRNVMVVI